MDSSQSKASKRRKRSLAKIKEENKKDGVENTAVYVDLQNSNYDFLPSNAESKNHSKTNSTEMSPPKKKAKSSPQSAAKKVVEIKKRENLKKAKASARNSEVSSKSKPCATRTIADCFKNYSSGERIVHCPACKTKVSHSMINDHLDSCVETEGSNLMETNSETLPKNTKSEKIPSHQSRTESNNYLTAVDAKYSKKKYQEIENFGGKNPIRRKTVGKSIDISSNSNYIFSKSRNANISSKKIHNRSRNNEVITIDIDTNEMGKSDDKHSTAYTQNQSRSKAAISWDEVKVLNCDIEESNDHKTLPKTTLTKVKANLSKSAKQFAKSDTNSSTISESNDESNTSLHDKKSHKHAKRDYSEQSELIYDASEVSCHSNVFESVDDASEARFASRESEVYNGPISKRPFSRNRSELSESADDASEVSFCDTEDNLPDPYYLANFKLVLETVMSNEEDKSLFNEDDMKVIEKFQAFPLECQKLYIRLFQRKSGWFRCSKIDYPKIAKDLKPALTELQKAGFLEGEKFLKDLKETLQLLSATDLKDLAKTLHITQSKATQQKGQTKNDVIEAFINHGKTQRTLFGDPSTVILKRAKSVLGMCVRVSPQAKFVFTRVLLLFTMNIEPEDEENKFNGQRQQLSTIFLANIGKLLYPTYKVQREVKIFSDRDALVTFAKAYQDKHNMAVALEVSGKQQLDKAYSYYPKAKECYEKVLVSLKGKEKPFSSHLPIHLRCFSAEWVYTKMCYLGVEALQKKKCYDEAVEQLESLLQQDIYCADCRGKWWDRLSLNVHQHLKQPFKALEICKQGLEDPYVRFGRRLALVQRVRQIRSSGAYKKKKDSESECKIDEDLLTEPNPAETITIQGQRSEQGGIFIAHEVTKNGEVKQDTKTFLSVEEYALSHYRQQGYDEGIHGETSTFMTLYGLLLWDIIFSDDIPDVFRTMYQAAPLDMNYDTFYKKRQSLIDQRLDEIKVSSIEDLQGMVEKRWNEDYGKMCSGVSWERFDSVDQAKQFVSCVGGKVLAGVFKHFAEDMRHWHSGMPDLVVWNSTNLNYRIVEVKGPNDRLSTKQQIWLDELASLGATVEVCYVTAVGGKKFRLPDN